MSLRRPLPLTPAGGAVLRVASLLVSRDDRSEWLAEWRGEFHHVVHGQASPRTVFTFSLGAIPDALWMRLHSAPPRSRLESPRRCLVELAGLATASIALTLLVPAARR